MPKQKADFSRRLSVVGVRPRPRVTTYTRPPESTEARLTSREASEKGHRIVLPLAAGRLSEGLPRLAGEAFHARLV